MSSQPQVHLLFGFLGSGKTTLVRKLLEKTEPETPTAVIVNEFGEVGIDGAIIEGSSIDTVELVSGCICCTLKGSLMSAIEELTQEKGVRRIVVEATGVADPEDMLDDLEDTEVIDALEVAPIVTVVDASGFNKIRPMLGDFYVSQILNSDVLIINKIDRTDEAQLDDVTRQIKEINPWGEIAFAEFCDVDTSLVFSNTESALLERHEEASNGHHSHHHHEHEHDRDVHEHHHHEHDSMESFVIAPREDISRSELQEFCSQLPDNAWRMKGHMLVSGRPSLIQYSTGQLEIFDSEARSHYRMVVIGRDLDQDAIAAGLGVPIANAA